MADLKDCTDCGQCRPALDDIEQPNGLGQSGVVLVEGVEGEEPTSETAFSLYRLPIGKKAVAACELGVLRLVDFETGEEIPVSITEAS